MFTVVTYVWCHMFTYVLIDTAQIYNSLAYWKYIKTKCEYYLIVNFKAGHGRLRGGTHSHSPFK